MKEYQITAAQSGYLMELARITEQYRSTLENLKSYADREMAALAAGNVWGGRYYQLLGEASSHKEAVTAHVNAATYVLMGMTPEYRTELMQLAVKGEERWFCPKHDDAE